MDYTQEMLNKLVPYDVEGINKIRVGRNADGGYIIPQEAMMSCELCLSFGISDDISFEEHLCSLQPMPIYAYDPTIDSFPSIQTESLEIYFIKKGLVSYDLQQYILAKRNNEEHKHSNIQKYHPYFQAYISRSKNNRASMLSAKTLVNEVEQHWDITTIDEIIEKNQLSNKKIGIKMDIEGSEFDSLKEIKYSVLAQTQFLALEFHFLDSQYFIKEAIDVLENLSPYMTLIHVHPNNCASTVTVGDIRYAEVLECTFINNSYVTHKTKVTKHHYSYIDRANYAAKEINMNYIEKTNHVHAYGEQDTIIRSSNTHQPTNIFSMNHLSKLVLKILFPLDKLITKIRRNSIDIRELRAQIEILQSSQNISSKIFGLFNKSLNISELETQSIISYKAMLKIEELILPNPNALTIVEQGCGLSTIFIAKLLQLQSCTSTQSRLISFEIDKDRANIINSALQNAKLNTYVTIISDALVKYTIAGRTCLWYPFEEKIFSNSIDILLLRNNMENILQNSVCPSIPLLYKYFSKYIQVLLDIENKQVYWDIVNQWENDLEKLSDNATVKDWLSYFD